MDCGGKLANNPDYSCILLDYDTYSGGELECAYNADTKSCEIKTDNCTLIEPVQSVEVGPREECNNRTLVCQEGYSCIGLTYGSLRLCLQECKDDSSVCGTGNYCDTTNSVWDSDAVCWGVSGPDGTCLPGATTAEGACTGEGANCIPNGIGMGHECKITCSGANVDKQGTEGGCADDEWCLADNSGYTDGLEYQLGEDSEPLDCSNDSEVCDVSAKYNCRKIQQDGESKSVCARPAGRCGTKLATIKSFTENDLASTTLSSTQYCNYLGKSQYCEGYSEMENVTAKVECTALSFGYRLMDNSNTPYPCDNLVDCSIRGAECINWTQGAACGYIASVCVSFCESADGSESFSCPDDQVCAAPETRIDFVREQGDDGNTRSCANGGTCGEGFTCTTFTDGDFCIRYRKVCRDTPADPCLALDCGENGTCVDTAGTASCSCADGYAGTTCDECAQDYIDDGNGTCILSCALDCGENGSCDNSNGTDECICDVGYAGDACENCDANFALWNGNCTPCPASQCNNHGACSFTEVGAFACTCDTGYTGDSCESCAEGYSIDINGNCQAVAAP